MDFLSADAFIHSLDAISSATNTHTYAFGDGIARARTLLQLMGGAPTATQRCAIVTGSKGKGSTVMMMAHILAAAGHRVGVFTGPHLHCATERFALIEPDKINGAKSHEMPQKSYVALAEQVRTTLQNWKQPALGLPTRFEAFTAMAYRWFELERCDFNIIEVGIGGRNDATNLANPKLAVFTNISLEHTQILGHTLAQIAREKAGIMRCGCAAITARQPADVVQELSSQARGIGAKFSEAAQHWQVHSVSHVLDHPPTGQWVQAIRAPGREPPLRLFLPLAGHVQEDNLEAALAALDALRPLGLAWSIGDIQPGLAALRWPARFEVLLHHPLTIADGAHTPHAIQSLLQSLHKSLPDRALHVVFGAMRDKDVPAMLKELLQVAASVQLASFSHKRSVPAYQLADWATPSMGGAKPGLTMMLHDNPDDAFTRAWDESSRTNGLVLVCGSLHLAAAAQLWAARRVNAAK